MLDRKGFCFGPVVWTEKWHIWMVARQNQQSHVSGCENVSLAVRQFRQRRWLRMQASSSFQERLGFSRVEETSSHSKHAVTGFASFSQQRRGVKFRLRSQARGNTCALQKTRPSTKKGPHFKPPALHKWIPSTSERWHKQQKAQPSLHQRRMKRLSVETLLPLVLCPFLLEI